MNKCNKKLGQRGDTIIEVLLAMLVVGLALGIGYSIASNAFNTGRNSQERSEALKLAESQLERLKVHIAESNDVSISYYEDTDTYCILPSQPLNSVTPVPDITDQSNACNGLNGGLYSIRIEYTAPVVGPPAAPELYKSIVIWETIGSGLESNVELLYRP